MEVIVKIILVAILALISGVLMSIPVWLLWNAVIPDVFKLPEITFWQAMGISILASCLFQNSSSSSKD